MGIHVGDHLSNLCLNGEKMCKDAATKIFITLFYVIFMLLQSIFENRVYNPSRKYMGTGGTASTMPGKKKPIIHSLHTQSMSSWRSIDPFFSLPIKNTIKDNGRNVLLAQCHSYICIYVHVYLSSYAMLSML